MNAIILIGRLTQDPELKYTQSGKAFCSFTLAVNREFKKDEADFIRCVAWEKTAEIIAKYLKKGNQTAVNGRLSVRKYEKDGENKIITEVLVGNIQFLGGNKDSENTNNKETIKENKPAPKKESESHYEEDDDEFPF